MTEEHPAEQPSAAGVPGFEQLPQDAALLQGSQRGHVLSDDRDVVTAARLVAFVAVAQGAEEGVVLIGGEVVPAESRAAALHSMMNQSTRSLNTVSREDAGTKQAFHI